MSFNYSDRTREMQQRLTSFMDQHVYPNEDRFHHEVDANRQKGNAWQPTAIVEELKPKAKAAGLWNLFLPDAQDPAHGLSVLEYAPIADEGVAAADLPGFEPMDGPGLFDDLEPEATVDAPALHVPPSKLSTGPRRESPASPLALYRRYRPDAFSEVIAPPCVRSSSPAFSSACRSLRIELQRLRVWPLTFARLIERSISEAYWNTRLISLSLRL